MHRDYPDVFPKEFNIYPSDYFRKRINTNRLSDILLESGKTYRYRPGDPIFYETVNGKIEKKEYYLSKHRIISYINFVIEYYERIENATDHGIINKVYSSIEQVEEHLVSNGLSMKGVDLCSYFKNIYNDKTIVYFKIVPGTARTSQDYPYHKITFINTSVED